MDEQYLIDETTRWLLDQIKLSSGDKVTINLADAADDKTGFFSLIIEVNGVQQDTAIAYNNHAEFVADQPMLNDYFARRLGVKKQKIL